MKNSIICALFLTGIFAISTAFIPPDKISFETLKARPNHNNIPVYYLNGVPFSGTTSDFYPERQVHREYEILEGFILKQTGWYADGKTEREMNYQNGILHGKTTIYHRNGNLFSEENNCNGFKEGKQYYYNCDGSLRLEQNYMGGIEILKLEYEYRKCAKDCKVDEGC